MRILHISDLHIGNEKGEIGRSKNIKEWLQAQQWNGDRPVIVATGDIVNDGRKKQYEEAGKLFEDLEDAGYAVLACPGNHDYGYGGGFAKAEKIETFSSYLGQRIDFPTVTHCNNVFVIGINSMAAEVGFFDRFGADGEVGRRQIGDLKEDLADIREDDPQAKIVVYLHHHPFLFPDDSWLEVVHEKLIHQLKDGGRFLKAVKKNIDVLLFGHEHRHIDFSKWKRFGPKRLGIPLVLSCTKSTKVGRAYTANEKGLPQKTDIVGQLGYLIDFPEDGAKPQARTVDFLTR